jgi:hypothetical protein
MCTPIYLQIYVIISAFFYYFESFVVLDVDLL